MISAPPPSHSYFFLSNAAGQLTTMLSRAVGAEFFTGGSGIA